MEEENTKKEKRTKKRTRNQPEWQREKRKRLRIAGKSYVNSRGDFVNERKIGEDCKCRRKCYVRVPEDQRNKLFDGYYSLKSHDEQNAYLFGLIRKHDIARKRCKESDKRTCSYKYYVRIRGSEVQVCRLAFAHIHGISPHKITVLCRKQDQNVMFPRDGRGKHSNRPRKIPEDTVSHIKDHIFSIINSDRVLDFLKDEKHNGPDVNLTKMWKDYLKTYDPKFSEIILVNTETDISKDSSDINDTDCQLMTEFSNSELIDDPPAQANSTTVNLPEYAISSVTDTLGILAQHSETELCCKVVPKTSKANKKKFKHIPVVKHWLYTKVFHEEFNVHDFANLKKKLCQLKDLSKSSNSPTNKADRKQKTPKKINREKDISSAPIVSEPFEAFHSNTPDVETPVLEIPLQDLNQGEIGQETDLYILPINLQDLVPLPAGPDVNIQAQPTTQFNFQTTSSPNSVLSPLVNASPTVQDLQCSNAVTLPPASVNFTQNSCNYMNLNMAAFY